jgi:hypothetical protein
VQNACPCIEATSPISKGESRFGADSVPKANNVAIMCDLGPVAVELGT